MLGWMLVIAGATAVDAGAPVDSKNTVERATNRSRQGNISNILVAPPKLTDAFNAAKYATQ
jgi:hypothetical protein